MFYVVPKDAVLIGNASTIARTRKINHPVKDTFDELLVKQKREDAKALLEIDEGKDVRDAEVSTEKDETIDITLAT